MKGIMSLIPEPTEDDIPEECLGMWETTEEEDAYYASIIDDLGIEL